MGPVRCRHSCRKYCGGSFERGWIGTVDGITWQAFSSYEAGRIGFVSDRDGNLEIYTIDTSGRDEVNLTRNSAHDYSAVWSPDGRMIAFLQDTADDNVTRDLRIVAISENGNPLGDPTRKPAALTALAACSKDIPLTSGILASSQYSHARRG